MKDLHISRYFKHVPAKHVGGGKDIDMRVGMAMHIMFNSIKKVWREFSGDHVVMCLEGSSWRKDFYAHKAKKKTQWINVV